MNTKTVFKTSMITLALGGGLALSSILFAADEKAPAPSTETIKGEIVDLMCYIDHGAKGEKHKGCAEKCIKGGGPVGLLSGDRLYLVVGDHQPVNEELAPKAAQTVTLKGKVVERHGIRMIENAQIVE
ncbi:MAG: hypothetical protein ACLQVX_11460 [Limisphaerales bacterium]